MPPSTARGFDFTPLRSFDDPESTLEELGAEEGATLRQLLSSQCFCRALFWTLCSATAIYTTKLLMTTHAFHYPLTIAFRSFAAILMIYAIFTHLKTQSSNTAEAKPWRWTLRQSDDDDFLFNTHWLTMVPASLAAAVSLPMLLEGLLHMPSLPVLVMLFPLVYTAESVVHFISCSPSRFRKWFPFEVILATVASAVVLCNEYRLMVPGLIWGVTGVLFIGLSRALFVISSERTESDFAVQARLQDYHGFVIMTLIFGITISGVLAYHFERTRSPHLLSTETIGLMFINIASFISTAFSRTFIFAYSPISFQEAKSELSNIPIRSLEFLPSTGSSLLVVLIAMHLNPVSVSWVQIAAFFTASLSLVGFEQIHKYLFTLMDNTQDHITKSFSMETTHSQKPSRVLTGLAVSFLVMVFSRTLFTLSSASINSLAPGLPSKLDTLYRPVARFEIVVSMYDEAPIQVKEMLDAVKSTTFLSTIEPLITIYTKNHNHDLDELKETTGANTVDRLNNLGREGGTYLSHIVNKWDSLAEQTLFIQAHAHNMREIVPRINSYLVPETGFLSLGFTGVTCNCEACTDRWGWEDKWGVIPAVYQTIHSLPCSTSTPILLTYKGQFVASARRIRGIERNFYASLLETITSREGWSHNSTVIGEGTGGVTGIESPDNPYFGFTMERIWGMVMQCATDQMVAARCPSLLSGMGRGGRVEDCQCLDRGG